MDKKIRMFWDLDGTLINFYRSASVQFNVEYLSKSFIKDNLYEIAGGKKYFWKKINGHTFWSSLDKYSWSDDCVKLANELSDDWIFLTKSSLDSGSASGKFSTIQKFWPREINRLWIVTGSKARICRNKYDILIDDKAANGQEWTEQGGTFFHWKELSDDWDEQARIYMKDLRELVDKLKNS